MLGNFKYESIIDTLNFKCIQNGRNLAFELYVDDCTNNLIYGNIYL